MRHSVAHRPQIGEGIKSSKEKKEPRTLGPPDSSSRGEGVLRFNCVETAKLLRSGSMGEPGRGGTEKGHC